MKLTLKRSTNSTAKAPRSSGKLAARLKGMRRDAERFVLFIGDEGAILLFMQGNTVLRRLFAPTSAIEHTRSMVDLMGQHPHAPVAILCDVLDQQYIRQTFPPVSALSVEGLVSRRLERDFQPGDLTGSIRIGREDTARKDWVYLLVALANTAFFQQWVGLILEQPNYLQGVYLSPVEGQIILPLLLSHMPHRPEKPAAWQMMISHHKVSGFRIIVLRDGKLAFTRVSQAIGDAQPAVIAGNVEQEIQNTIEYIRRLGYAETAGLEVLAITAAEVRDSIDAKRIQAQTMHLLTPVDVAEELSLQQAALAADRFGDVVFSATFATMGKRRLRLYPAYARSLDQLHKARLGIKVTSIMLIVACLGLTAKATFSALSISKESNASQAALAKAAPELSLLQKQVEKLGEEANIKNDVTAFYDKLEIERYSPSEALKATMGIKRSNVSISAWEWVLPTAVLLQGEEVVNAPPAPPTDPNNPTLGPVVIKSKVSLKGTFLDNEMTIAAINEYKDVITKDIKTYTVQVNSPELVAGGSAKISVAIGGDASESAPDVSSAPELEVILSGPLPAAAGAATAAGGATP